MNISGIYGRGRLEQENMNFVLRHGSMLDHSWHNEKLSFVNVNGLVAKLHSQHTLRHQEQFVFILMVMPNELAFQFCCFDMLTIQLTNDSGIPVVGDEIVFFLDVNFFHD